MSDIKPGKKFFSVVFEIEDPTAFTDVAVKYSTAMLDDLVEQGARVTACGWGDYATERDALVEGLQSMGIDTDDVVAEYVEREELNVSAQDITG